MMIVSVDLFRIIFIYLYSAGKNLADYEIPLVKQITTGAFGGPKQDIIFVTIALNVKNRRMLEIYTELNGKVSAGAKVKV